MATEDVLRQRLAELETKATARDHDLRRDLAIVKRLARLAYAELGAPDHMLDDDIARARRAGVDASKRNPEGDAIL